MYLKDVTQGKWIGYFLHALQSQWPLFYLYLKYFYFFSASVKFPIFFHIFFIFCFILSYFLCYSILFYDSILFFFCTLLYSHSNSLFLLTFNALQLALSLYYFWRFLPYSHSMLLVCSFISWSQYIYRKRPHTTLSIILIFFWILYISPVSSLSLCSLFNSVQFQPILFSASFLSKIYSAVFIGFSYWSFLTKFS